MCIRDSSWSHPLVFFEWFMLKITIFLPFLHGVAEGAWTPPGWAAPKLNSWWEVTINLSLFSDYNPKTTTHGLGFKNREKALYTVDTIKNRPIKYQVNVIATMLGRAKKHPHKTKEMGEAIKIFSKWMANYKKNSKK